MKNIWYVRDSAAFDKATGLKSAPFFLDQVTPLVDLPKRAKQGSL